MQKNSQNFSMQDALRLAHSDAGQQLFSLLKESDGKALQQAAELAAAGDYRQAGNALSKLLEDPQIRALLKQLET